ncbi:flagellar hook-basal body complex protein [Hydrogenimonas sp.]
MDSAGQSTNPEDLEAQALLNNGKTLAQDFKVLFNEKGESLQLKPGDTFRIHDNTNNTDYSYAYGTDFTTTQDLLSKLEKDLGVTAIINAEGKIEITNNSGNSLDLTVYDGDANGENKNELLYDIMAPLSGVTPDGETRYTQPIYSATHASSIDVFDSLGTKHTLRISFRKISQAEDTSEWNMIISVPNPSEINTVDPKNYLVGSITFNNDGSLSTYAPTSVNFTANNGSAPNQTIKLDLGTAGAFDGMTSFDNPSSTTGISQDGYPGGDLNGIRVDETGTLIGSFTNGRSFGLAQVAMASFANNEGLESDGGNTFIQTSNSGDPIIGAPSTGKRGFITASALEMSNVDLSRSLTQLIIVQRGFQANSKTITTSDQMLQTLLQLKQ